MESIPSKVFPPCCDECELISFKLSVFNFLCVCRDMLGLKMKLITFQKGRIITIFAGRA